MLYSTQIHTDALWCTCTRKHACLMEHESRLFIQIRERVQNEEAAAFVNTELSFTQTVPLLSNMHSKHVQCKFSNHVVFSCPCWICLPYHSIYRIMCSSWNQLPTFVISLWICFFLCVSVWCCHVTLLHEWFCMSLAPHGWVDLIFRDIRTAGELSLPSTVASKKTSSVHTSHPWRQTSDFLFF